MPINKNNIGECKQNMLNESESKQNIQIENESKQNLENSNELENENSIFYIDDSDEDFNINLLENENKKVDDELNLFSFNHNSEHSIQPSVDVHFNNNLDDSINLYYDINAF